MQQASELPSDRIHLVLKLTSHQLLRHSVSSSHSWCRAPAKLSLSIEALNERYWSPRKDMAANRLISGPLQLAKDQGTCLLLDETAMQQGRLDDHGCRNLRRCKLWLKARQVSSTVAILSFLSRGALLACTNDVPTRIWNRIHPPLIQSVEYDFVYSKAVWPASVPTRDNFLRAPDAEV